MPFEQVDCPIHFLEVPVLAWSAWLESLHRPTAELGTEGALKRAQEQLIPERTG